MDPVVAALVIASAVLHPLREVYIKDNAYPEGLAFAVMTMFALLSGIHVAAVGSDPWAAFEIWPIVIASGVFVVLYFQFTVMCVKLGDVSVYYPIMRSSPLFVVVVGYFVLGQRYPFVLLAGIAIVLVSAFLLQYERGGTRVFDNWRALVLAVAAMCAHGVVTLVDAEAMRSVRPEQLFVVMQPLVVLPVMAALLVATRPRGRGAVEHLFAGWRATPWRFMSAGILSYLSYYLLLGAFHLGGNVAAVASLRQISIPVSVLLGALVLGERRLMGRFGWSALLAFGVALILVAR
ncbi:MAG: hypothetical protein OXU81_24875 [Gammaproteobacteria bacterium]|nr:hypothetical protein [Gammaproteobacteria bacterium]